MVRRVHQSSHVANHEENLYAHWSLLTTKTPLELASLDICERTNCKCEGFSAAPKRTGLESEIWNGARLRMTGLRLFETLRWEE